MGAPVAESRHRDRTVGRTSAAGERLVWLDGLRAIAAGMVFLHHVGPGTPLVGLDAGVLVFFTLSGYLLYRPFLDDHVDLWSYAMRRLFRIAPAYLVASLALTWLYQVPLDPVGILTMSHTPVVVAWTLQIEVVFYAALPLIAFLAVGSRKRLWLLAAVSLAIGAASILLTRVFPGGFLPWAWAFVPGMIVAQLSATGRRSVHPLLIAVAVLLLAVSIVPDVRYPDIPTAIGSAIILAWLLTLPAPRQWLARAMAVAGALSYSFYLWHEAIHDLVGPATYLNAAIVLVLTTLISAVVYVLVERPAIGLGRRLGALHPTMAWSRVRAGLTD